jgi:hypothetical protein
MATTLFMRARRLTEQYGFSIIPVDRASKQPSARWKAFQQRRSTERDWRQWFPQRHPANLGIVTGAVSGIVVVDVDSDAGREYVAAHLPPTPMRVTTGGGGEHHYYRHPGGVVSNKVRLPGDAGARVAVDVRADGGYVIGPGSLHPRTGRYYVAPEPWPPSLDALPVFDPSWIAAPSRNLPPRRPAVDTALPVVERARRYLAAVPPAIEGHGGDAHTFMVACRLVRGFSLDDATALELLTEWNAGCVPPWSERELMTKIRNASLYGSEPVGGRR